MAELLVELLSEEIPAGMQAPAGADFRRHMVDALSAAELTFDEARTAVAPRRLTLVVEGLPSIQPERTVERKGPRTNAPDKAIEGFLRAAGVNLGDCEIRDDQKGAYYVAVMTRPGGAVKDMLGGMLADAVAKVSWPKSMRWGTSRLRWVRPLHNVLAIFDGEPLAGGLDLDGSRLAFTDRTYGHRFLKPEPISVVGFADYTEKLRRAFVIVDAEERRRLIARALAAAAGELGLTCRDDPALLGEVAGLVEWPVVMVGEIDPQFMELPPEVLTASMRSHQRYFAFERPDGKLASKFGFVANTVADDGGAAIVAGNERVLRARLADARYFWDQDRKVRLEDRVPALSGIVFHAKLGTLGAKVQRIQALAADLTEAVPGSDVDRVRSAATLAKADLVTGMVGEFPELQGIMGRYYALAEGEAADVADAIADHYSPAGPDDACPAAPTGIAVALADKIDTLVGFWAIGEKPTGSKDPFALRRAALGVIRIVLENRLRLALLQAFDTAAALHKVDDKAVAVDLMSFVAERLKVHLRDEGTRHDHIAAVFALTGEDDLVRLLARVEALGSFLASENGANLLTAYRRAANIVRAETKKDGETYAGSEYDAELARADAAGVEATLWGALRRVEDHVDAALAAEKFADAMAMLASLREPVDQFFDNVTVNVDDSDIRRNRLRLLARIQQVMNHVADFSKIEG